MAFAYDGSDLAKLAIEQAGNLLGTGRDALVLTVWTPFDVGFVPAVGLRFNAADPEQVKQAAEQTAAEGASLAESVGFRARSLAVQSAPTWEGIVPRRRPRRQPDRARLPRALGARANADR